MCEWGNVNDVKIKGHFNKNGKPFYVDKCIANLIQALNDGGVSTVASCCGHGKGFGNIILRDGRELIIMPDYESSRRAEKKISPLKHKIKKRLFVWWMEFKVFVGLLKPGDTF